MSTTPTNVRMAIGPATRGLPMTAANQTMFTSAISGGGSTATLFHKEWQLIPTYRALVGAGWQVTTDASGNPQCSVQAGGGSLTVSPVLNQAVIQNQATPATFQSPASSSNYNIVGMLTVTIAYQEQPVWYIEAPLGVIDSFAISQLAGLAWTNLLQPIVQSFVSSLRQCLTSSIEAGSEDAVADAAASAAEAGAIESEVVGDIAISLELGFASLIGIALLIALPIILALLLHTSYHNLKVYNFTSYNLTWLKRIVEGTMSSYPVLSAGSQEADPLIPAIMSWAPPGLTPVSVATEADFSFVSDSEITGIEYYMYFQLTDPTSSNPVSPQIPAHFVIPWSGDNTIFISPSDETWPRYALQCMVQAPSPNLVLATVTMDALDGKQPTPSGGSAYMYNSVVVFWEGTGGQLPPELPASDRV